MRYDKLLIVATRAARPARKASARNARFETRFVVRNARASPLGLERCLHVFIEKFSKKSECNKYKSCPDKELKVEGPFLVVFRSDKCYQSEQEK